MPAKKSFEVQLIKIIKDEIAKQPFELDGYKWAVVIGQDGLADHLGVCTRTLSGRLKTPPFKSRVKRINGERSTLIRFREPGEPDVTPDELMRAKLNEARKAMELLWQSKTQKWPDFDAKTLLWGFAKDLAAFPAVDPVEVFNSSLQNWPHTASAIKLAQLATPAGKVKFYGYPSIGLIRVFWKSVLHAYVMRQMESGKISSDKLNDFAAVLNATDFDVVAKEPTYTEDYVAVLMTKKAPKIEAAKQGKKAA